MRKKKELSTLDGRRSLITQRLFALSITRKGM